MLQIGPQDNVQKALDNARPGEVIRLAEGDYRIKTAVFTPGLTLEGAGADRTRILWDDYAKKLDKTGAEYNTFRTWCAPTGSPCGICPLSTTPFTPRKRGRRWRLPSMATGS